MRDTVIQIASLIDGTRTPFDGQYVVEYDPDRAPASPCCAHLVTTPDIESATRYTKLEALELWRKVDPEHPLRRDGKPNRPLTAFSVAIIPAQ